MTHGLSAKKEPRFPKETKFGSLGSLITSSSSNRWAWASETAWQLCDSMKITGPDRGVRREKTIENRIVMDTSEKLAELGLKENQILVLYDGVCMLCNSSVQFLVARNPTTTVIIESLQSDVGQKLLTESGLGADYTESVVTIDQVGVHTHSDAIVRIARELSFPWSLGRIAWIMPRFLRDFFYNIVAKRRYKLFGKTDQCMLPTPKMREHLLSMRAPG